MTDSLVKALVDPWSSRWKTTAVGTALLFWLSGVVIYLSTHDSTRTMCTAKSQLPVWCELNRQPKFGAVVLPILAVTIVAASAAVAARLSPALLDLLSGTPWAHHRRFSRVTNWRIGRHRTIRRSTDNRDEKVAEPRTFDDWYTNIRIDQSMRLARLHPRETVPAPTRIGNIFAAAAQRVERAYGLNFEICWPILATVVPADTRAELVKQASDILLKVQALIFAACIPVWIIFMPSILPAALLLLIAAALTIYGFRSLIQSVQAYVSDIEITFLTYRHTLYDSIGFPRPRNTSTERLDGQRLSTYLAYPSAVGSVSLQWRSTRT